MVWAGARRVLGWTEDSDADGELSPDSHVVFTHPGVTESLS